MASIASVYSSKYEYFPRSPMIMKPNPTKKNIPNKEKLACNLELPSTKYQPISENRIIAPNKMILQFNMFNSFFIAILNIYNKVLSESFGR
jgi:hypothetical protein